MRFLCTDPLNATARLIDIARRLGLDLASLSVSRRDRTIFVLSLELADPACLRARILDARLQSLPDLVPEPENAV